MPIRNDAVCLFNDSIKEESSTGVLYNHQLYMYIDECNLN